MIFRRTSPELPRGDDVRRAERRDVPRLVEMWGQLMAMHASVDPRFTLRPNAAKTMAQRFQALMQERNVLILVSEAEGQIVGFTVGHVDANLPFFQGSTIGFISDLYVEEAFRRQGRARRLVQGLDDWFHKREVSSVQLHAAACNPDARQFWRSLGYSDFLIRMEKAPS